MTNVLVVKGLIRNLYWVQREVVGWRLMTNVLVVRGLIHSLYWVQREVVGWETDDKRPRGEGVNP